MILVVLAVVFILLIDGCAAYIWIRLIRRLDTYHKLKWKKNIHIRFFILGIASVIPTLLLYEIFDPLFYSVYYTNSNSYLIDSFIYNFLFNGPIEEFSKFIVFFWAAKRNDTIKEPQDGLFQAGLVALGFAAVENIRYAIWYGLDVLFIRSVINIPGHMLYTSLIGGVAALYLIDRKTGRDKNTSYNLVLLIFLAGFFHGGWNFFLDIDREFFSYVVKALNFAVIYIFLKEFKELSPYKKYPNDQYKKAIVEISRWIERTPDNYILHKRIAHYYLWAGNYEKAEAHIREYLTSAPHDIVATFYLGVILILRGEAAEGAEYASSVLSTLTEQKQKRLDASLTKSLKTRDERETVRKALLETAA
jgi:RsiW-degrading membrane proteinase PrsW (M82 family)